MMQVLIPSTKAMKKDIYFPKPILIVSDIQRLGLIQPILLNLINEFN